MVDQSRLLSSHIETQTFGASSCALGEGCVDSSGTRRLLRFTTVTNNQGELDMSLGSPQGSGLFRYDTCHGHYHFSGYASYRLVDANGGTVATGRKQSFCLADSFRFSGNQPATYDCDNQGISAGWGDTYASDIDCQWVDITNVTPGNYFLEVIVNPDHLLNESNYGNNTARVPVTIP